jgi:PEP-CTERM motif
MRKHLLLLIASLIVFASVASAAPITYQVTVNTSSIAGTTGSLDFNFNPGPLVTQAASIQIQDFTSNGTLAEACPCGTGDVTGQLPSTVTIDNGTAYNDYFDDFTFGSTLSFDLSFYGPALTAPNGTSTSGSTFAFSMFSDPAGTVPALTSNTTYGYAAMIDVNLNGTTTPLDYSSETTITAVPEPGTWSLMALGIGLCLIVRRFAPGHDRCRSHGVLP